MSPASQDDKRKKEIEILNRAFQAFNEATTQLQNSYDKLQARVKTLDLELAKKNKALEKNLREKEEVKNYLHNILESLTSGVIVVDREGIVTTFNRAAGAITGIQPETGLGRPLETLFSFDLFENVVSRLMNTESPTLSLDREITAGDGRAILVRVFASPVLDHGERPIGTVLIVQDITNLRRLEEEVHRNQRLRAMGEMAAGIAHEIRNPLGSIELFASVLKKELENDEDNKKIAEHICSGVRNMDRIISSLLLFAKSPQPSRQKCDINRLLQERFEDAPDLGIPENIRIIREFQPGNLWVKGDGELLKQVFINLIRNSVQAMPQGGDLRLKTEWKPETPSPASSEVASSRHVSITVSDSGSGIPSGSLEKIFHPFFSTKDKGTGLGLAIAHNIIKAHQGTIDAESEEGRGAHFIVKIPGWDDAFDEE